MRRIIQVVALILAVGASSAFAQSPKALAKQLAVGSGDEDRLADQIRQSARDMIADMEQGGHRRCIAAQRARGAAEIALWDRIEREERAGLARVFQRRLSAEQMRAVLMHWRDRGARPQVAERASLDDTPYGAKSRAFAQTPAGQAYFNVLENEGKQAASAPYARSFQLGEFTAIAEKNERDFPRPLVTEQERADAGRALALSWMELSTTKDYLDLAPLSEVLRANPDLRSRAQAAFAEQARAIIVDSGPLAGDLVACLFRAEDSRTLLAAIVQPDFSAAYLAPRGALEPPSPVVEAFEATPNGRRLASYDFILRGILNGFSGITRRLEATNRALAGQLQDEIAAAQSPPR